MLKCYKIFIFYETLSFITMRIIIFYEKKFRKKGFGNVNLIRKRRTIIFLYIKSV